MIPFVKAHACGNDFLIIEEPLAQRRHADLARKLCARNTSVGADGIEFLERKANGDFFLRLFNADGSEAELSGNGTRCVAAWLARSEGKQDVALGTHGGLRTCHVVEAADPLISIESDTMGDAAHDRSSGRRQCGGSDGERRQSSLCSVRRRRISAHTDACLAGTRREDQHQPAFSARNEC